MATSRDIESILKDIEDDDWEVRLAAVKCLSKAQDPGLLDHLLSACRDSDESVRKAAFKGASELDPSKAMPLAIDLLKDDDWSVRLTAVECLSKAQDPALLEYLLSACRDSNRIVQVAAFKGAYALNPSKAIPLAIDLLNDDDWKVRLAAVEFLSKAQDPALLEHLLSACRDSDEDVRKAAFKSASKLDPSKAMPFAIDLLNDDDWKVRLAAVECLSKAQDPALLEHLLSACRDSDEDVRKAAFEGISALDPSKAIPLAIDLLKVDHWEVRLAAVEFLSKAQDTALLEHLLAACRDSDEDVRKAAMTGIFKYDDERVPGELISSLRDVDKDIRKLAREILDEKHGTVPSLARLPIGADGKPAWGSVALRVDDLVYWGDRVGRELLGKPVRIQQYRQGLGRTGDDKRAKEIVVEVSDEAVTGGHPHGADVFRGLILHEIGHHLYDVGILGHKTIRGIAHSEGAGEIYDILRDERLERKLVSRRPEWGVYFDRLSSYLFSQREDLIPVTIYAQLIKQNPESTLSDIRKGVLPGRVTGSEAYPNSLHVSLTGKEQLAIPGLLPPLMLFLACLRCGFDPAMCPDPQVVEAVRRVPRNLKNLPHSEVLKVAREIGDLIGRSSAHKKSLEDLKDLLSQLGDAVSGLKKLLEKMAEMAGIPSDGDGSTAAKDDSHCRLPHLPDRPTQGPAQERAEGEIRHPDRDPENLPTAAHRRSRRNIQKPGFDKGYNQQPGFTFDLLGKTETLDFDPDRHAKLAASIRPHVRVLRAYFERLGTETVEEYASRRGRRFDMAQLKNAVMTLTPNVLVHSREEINPNAYMGILIDRSGSMDGERIELARKFGALMAESAKGLRGIEGHVSAFDDETFYRLGDFQRNAIAKLEAGGGNNDAGGLMRAAEMALRSRKKNKLLVMISDGAPTGCTFESLEYLVKRLTLERGIVCAQVAVAEMEEIAFPHFVDLSRFGTEEAVARFGRLLMRLTASWR